MSTTEEIREEVIDILDRFSYSEKRDDAEKIADQILSLLGEEHKTESYYVSRTPDGKVWTSSRNPQEILDQIQGRLDLTFEKLDVYTRHRGNNWEDWQPDVATIFRRVIHAEILKNQRSRRGHAVKQ